jgi:hypothetical protein
MDEQGKNKGGYFDQFSRDRVTQFFSGTSPHADSPICGKYIGNVKQTEAISFSYDY